MSKNIEILNYLNLISPKIGKSYKLRGINPLPDGFEVTEEKIKERLLINQMQEFVSLPEFVHGEKNIIKKNIKNSIKNIKKILKNQNFDNFSAIMAQKIKFYLEVRKEMSKIILKEFKKFDFNEIDAFWQVYAIDPIMSELLVSLFDKEFDFESIFADFEERYTLSYLEKIKLLEKRKKKARVKTEKIAVEKKEKTAKVSKSKSSEKSTEKAAKSTKTSKKDVKNTKILQKTDKNQEKTPTITKNTTTKTQRIKE